MLHRIGDLVHTGQKLRLQLLQITLVHQTLNHIITGNQYIIVFLICHLDIHLLIGIEVFHGDSCSGCLLKIRNYIFSHIFAGHIDRQGLSRIGKILTGGTDFHQTDQENHSGCRAARQYKAPSAHFVLLLPLRHQHGYHIDQHQYNGDNDNHQR